MKTQADHSEMVGGGRFQEPVDAGTANARDGDVKNSSSTIHYQPPAQPQVSKKAALIVFASAIGLAITVISIVH